MGIASEPSLGAWKDVTFLLSLNYLNSRWFHGLKHLQAISGAEKGEPVALLLSPSYSIPLPAVESSRHQSGSLFTIFLTTPLQAFCLLIGLSGSDIEMVKS